MAAVGVMLAATAAGYTAASSPYQPSPERSTVYVANLETGTVTPVFPATRRVGRPIKVAKDPDALAAAPDGKTVYVASANFGGTGHGYLTPIRAAANAPLGRIRVGDVPSDVAISPDGKTAWVVNYDTITPVSTATRRAGIPVRVVSNDWDQANAIVISPNGRTAYIATSFTVVPVSLLSRKAGKPIRLRNGIGARSQIGITPDGRKLYVLPGSEMIAGSDIFPIDATNDEPGKPIKIARGATAMAISPDGRTAYAGALVGKGPAYRDVIVPISTSSDKAGAPINIGPPSPDAGVSSLAVANNGSYVYVAAFNAVYPVNTRTQKVGRAIRVAPYGYNSEVIVISPDGKTAWVMSIKDAASQDSLLTPIDIAENKPGQPIRVGKDAVCLLVTTGNSVRRPEHGACAYIPR